MTVHRCRAANCDAAFLTRDARQAHAEAVHDRVAAPAKRVQVVTRTRLVRLPFAERHGMVCCWCGEPIDPAQAATRGPLSPTREHLVPRSLGGSNRAENLLLAHRRCNGLRGTIAADAFRRLMRGEALTRAELWPHLFEEPQT